MGYVALACLILLSGQDKDRRKEAPKVPVDLTQPGMPPRLEGQEERILCDLKLTPEQRSQWAAMEKHYTQKDREFREEYAQTGNIDKLLEQRGTMTKWVREQKKQILTPDQHRRYKAAWDKLMEPYFEAGKKAGGAIRPLNRDGTPSKYLLKPLTGPLKE
jgi:hypothetical protein